MRTRRAAEARLNAFLESYYGQPAPVLRARQVCYAGPAAGVAAWLAGYAKAGASHLVLRFAGEHERQMEAVAKVRRRWVVAESLAPVIESHHRLAGAATG